MTGVEILATQEVATAFTFNSTSFCIVLGIFIVGGFLLGAVAGIVECDCPSEYETQYKVTISDEVSMNEFLERYEIIDQEGKIYTVREVK